MPPVILDADIKTVSIAQAKWDDNGLSANGRVRFSRKIVLVQGLSVSLYDNADLSGAAIAEAIPVEADGSWRLIGAQIESTVFPCKLWAKVFIGENRAGKPSNPHKIHTQPPNSFCN
jgi:hypothetical protein